MPRPDPLPHLDSRSEARATLTNKLKRALRLLAGFAVVVAVIAAMLVARGQVGFHIHMLVTTFVGMGVAVFIGGALMLLIFYSAASGHDDLASRHDPEDDQ